MVMPRPESIDAYLAGVAEPARSTLEAVRLSIHQAAPGCVEAISYGCPAFLVDGRAVAGIAAFRHHCAYLPHSGRVFGQLTELLEGYEYTPGSLHFPLDEPLPPGLVRELIRVRLTIGSGHRKA